MRNKHKSNIKKGTYEDDNSETSSGEEQVDPRLDLRVLDVETGGDDTGLVEAAVELDDDFVGAMIVNDFEFTDVTWRKETKKKSGQRDALDEWSVQKKKKIIEGCSLFCELVSIERIEHTLYGWTETMGTSIFRSLKTKDAYNEKRGNRSYTPMKRKSEENKEKKRYSPWRCMTLKNLTTTLEEGRMSTWRLPRRSALTMLFKQSFW